MVEDQIEAGEYEVYASAASFSEASRLMRAAVVDRLGDDRTITLSDGSTIGPEDSEEDEPDDSEEDEPDDDS